MHHIVHYRRRVVRNNLRNAFPEKSEAELREIERKFYRYICDYMLEEVKMLRMSFKELCCRMEYDNKEEFLAMIERHGGIVLLIPHYANFEWIIGMGLSCRRATYRCKSTNRCTTDIWMRCSSVYAPVWRLQCAETFYGTRNHQVVSRQ